ncbi:hypothetical protein SEVIR_5G461850v4 [Setaria viridis]|uniref:Plant heme peroxidase family profile domain-containing protein n=1 Tax=Setaria viridis TaxID=4556 RepID=A0A4U6UR43_SETVI|nr:hypothetical protein SEVIR_5G461850v2 [Setaria viridis]
MIQNQGLQQQAPLDLIEHIHDTVHRKCGVTVSCADILALSTTHAIIQSGGHCFRCNTGIQAAAGHDGPGLTSDQLLFAFACVWS